MRNKVEMATVLANLERDHVRQGDGRKIVRGEFQISNFKGVDYDYDMLRLILVDFSLLFVAPIQTKSGIQIAWVQCEGYLENWRV